MNLTLIPSAFLPFCVIAALISIVSQRSHLLITLLALEAIILNLILLIIIASNLASHINLFLAIIILTFGACEATLGLACLVKIARTFGNDQIASLSINSC